MKSFSLYPISYILYPLIILLCVHAWSQNNERQPYIGYVYPAGGQVGTVFEITVGGQFLKDVGNVYVSGDGVSAKVIQYLKPLSPAQQGELARQLREIRQSRQSVRRGIPTQNTDTTAKSKTDTDKVTLPDYPQLQNLESKTGKELLKIARIFITRKKNQQIKESIAERVIIEVTIDPNAPPGDREIRLGTPAGLTNPICFQVGLLPEASEEDSLDPKSLDPNTPVTTDINIPVLVNGQIKTGEVDRFRFDAQRGQNLVIEAQARSLMPYLADAVPGWFQAALTLYDSNGNEVAFADHYQFNPDPVLFYKVPKDDSYELEIRDTLYRGREDFVYRVSIGELPFITGIFPLGGSVPVYSWITGWNLANTKVQLESASGMSSFLSRRFTYNNIQQTTFQFNKWVTNPVSYMMDTIPECVGDNSNDNMRHAQWILLPKIVNGRIAHPGDVNVFKFNGHAGEEIVAEVYARRLQSPLDSLLRFMDSKGRVLAYNDDFEDKECGLLTHQADSYLRVKLPEDGTYYVQLSDAQNHGGDEYAYRLRIGPPQPDFALRITPSSINIPAGHSVPVTVYAFRKDGFNGDIQVVLNQTSTPDNSKLQTLNPKLVLSGGRIPAGHDHVRMTLTAPSNPWEQPMQVQLEGHAQINGQDVSRPVVPAEDMMQAFAYRHLVPSQELLVAVTDIKRRGVNINLANDGNIQLPENGTAQVIFNTPPRFSQVGVQLKLTDPPKGITLRDVSNESGTLKFLLQADGKLVKAGYKDNLIVEVITEVERNNPNTKKTGDMQQVSLGTLPAIPVDIVK